MNDHFFNGFADELLKVAIWPFSSKKKTPPPKVVKPQKQKGALDRGEKAFKQTKKGRPSLVGGGQRKALRREGVFGM